MCKNGWTDSPDNAQSANSAKQEIPAEPEQQTKIAHRQNRKK